MRIRAEAVILAALAGTALGQAPSVSATVTQAITINAAGTIQSFAPGPMPATGVHLNVFGPGATGSIDCGPTSGHPPSVAGFEFVTYGLVQGSQSATLDGEVVVHLSAPAPTPVLITANGMSSATAFFATATELDVDNDQIVDFRWLTNPILGTIDEDGEFGLLVGPAGRSLRIWHQSGGSSSFGTVTSDLRLTFYAGASPLEEYGPGCIALTWTRGPVGGAVYAVPAGNTSLAFFAFGLNPQQTPLPFAPGCFQLTDVLFAVAALPVSGQATFAQSPIALPTGVEFRVQSAVIDGNGVIQTSNGLRMFGPN